ncbi:hypothetical protein [Nocardia gipuzkoensis]|jgi:hypothetical protein
MHPRSPNLLMRGTDRLESVIRILAILTCLGAIPVAVAAGIEDYTVAAERIRTDNTTKVPATATIALEPSRARRMSIAQVQWVHDGAPASATVIVPPPRCAATGLRYGSVPMALRPRHRTNPGAPSWSASAPPLSF